MNLEFCVNCGIRFPIDAKFCGKCGGERMKMRTTVPKEDDEGLTDVLQKKNVYVKPSERAEFQAETDKRKERIEKTESELQAEMKAHKERFTKAESESISDSTLGIRGLGVLLMIIAIGAYVVPISDGFTLSGASDVCSNPMMIGTESCVTIKWWMSGANIAGILGFICLVGARKISVWAKKNG